MKKNPNDLEKLHPDFWGEEKQERQLGMLVFSAKIYVSQLNYGIHTVITGKYEKPLLEWPYLP